MFEKAILIPGGGLNEDGTPHEWVKRSLDKAIALFSGKEVIIPLSRGTIYKPPVLDKKGFPIYESLAGAEYLMHKQIPAENIRVETESLDTIGNAYFSKLLFIDPMHIADTTIISTVFHMPRVKFVFEWVYGLHPRTIYKMEFITVTEEGLAKKMLAAREKKEAQRLAETEKVAASINDAYSFHMWLFRHHKAYALGTFAEDVLDEETLKTY